MATLQDFQDAFPRNAEAYFKAASNAMARHGIDIAECTFEVEGREVRVVGRDCDGDDCVWAELLPE